MKLEKYPDIRKTVSVEELKKEQNYKPINKNEMDQIIADLNIKEPIEDLLSILSKQFSARTLQHLPAAGVRTRTRLQ